MVRNEGKEEKSPGESFHQWVSPENRRGATPASSLEYEETDKGDVIIPFYELATARTMGRRIKKRFSPGQTVDTHVQEGAHSQAYQENKERE